MPESQQLPGSCSSDHRRHFLLLQMPCGPFGRQLMTALMRAGHRCTRVALNGGDVINSLPHRPVIYRKPIADWPSWISELARRDSVTDLICYGDCRAYHRAAIDTLSARGVTVHVLEEGYLRPNWITCERGGVNGYSALTRINLDTIGTLPPVAGDEAKLHPSTIRYCAQGVVYYTATLLAGHLLPHWQSHRKIDIPGEAALWLERLLLWPVRRWRTRRALQAIEASGKPFHLVLLQLNGDSQVKVHSRFDSVRDFVSHCIAEFAAGSTPETLLVFKNHPLDSGIVDLRHVIATEARRHGLKDRVFFVETGKLVPLLEKALSATAINSTACHQALLRGIPTMVLGRAVFNHPQIVPRMRLADFFRLRPCMNQADYLKLVSLMRHTCQFNGGFYSAEGRRILLPRLTRALIEGMPAVESLLAEPDRVPGKMQAS